MKLFEMFKRKNPIFKLTNEQKVSNARHRIEHSLKMFKKISEEIDDVNETLSEVIEQDKQQLEKIQLNINNATDELNANKALQEKINQFIL